MKCPKCRYEWKYKGKSKYYICCPRCMNKFKRKTYTNKGAGK